MTFSPTFVRVGSFLMASFFIRKKKLVGKDARLRYPHTGNSDGKWQGTCTEVKVKDS